VSSLPLATPERYAPIALAADGKKVGGLVYGDVVSVAFGCTQKVSKFN